MNYKHISHHRAKHNHSNRYRLSVTKMALSWSVTRLGRPFLVKTFPIAKQHPRHSYYSRVLPGNISYLFPLEYIPNINRMIVTPVWVRWLVSASEPGVLTTTTGRRFKGWLCRFYSDPGSVSQPRIVTPSKHCLKQAPLRLISDQSRSGRGC